MFATVSLAGINHCPDAYNLIMLVVRYLLTQRNSYIGRLQVEKRVNLIVQAYNARYFVVRDVNQYIMKLSSNLSAYSLDSTNSCYWHITAQEHAY